MHDLHPWHIQIEIVTVRITQTDPELKSTFPWTDCHIAIADTFAELLSKCHGQF
jgi:hypothetical protein